MSLPPGETETSMLARMLRDSPYTPLLPKGTWVYMKPFTVEEKATIEKLTKEGKLPTGSLTQLNPTHLKM